MTISSTANRVTYTGNAVTDAFAVTYPFLLAADLKVYQDGTLKTITTHYTVTGGSGSTGTVTFLMAPASGDDIVILRDPAVTQGLDLVENDPLPAEELEKAFDKLTMIAQRNRDLLNRAMVLSDSATGTVSLTLPDPTALNLIGWNSDEDALVNYDSGSLVGAVAAIDWLTDIFDGTAAQQDFTLTRDPGVASNCDVRISGVPQVPGVDYTVATTTISFTAAPPAGTGNVVVRYGSALPSAAAVPVDGVATASIQDGAVTTAKIDNGAVTAAKLDDAVVSDLATVTVASGDYVMLADTSDSSKKKKGLVSDILALLPASAQVATGAVFDYVGSTAPSGYVLLSGRTIGDATSGATERANADTQTLYELLWNNLANSEAAVSSGRGANATADFNAHKTIALPDARGRVVAGKDNMGGTTASRLTSGGSGIVGTTLGVVGGTETHTLSTAELANHSHSYDRTAQGSNAEAMSGFPVPGAAAPSSTSSGSAGSGNAHQNTQPTLVLNKIIKL